ncbi:MAG TPA: gephyrin-like molybdotransferase Glp [Thermoanaerobaculia bacterium]|nr:gephyrin-like molybdotransferase Glp [Thermoanaerobaculia bacterium]
MVSVDEALAIVARSCSPGRGEFVPLAESFGRVLAKAVTSDVAWPPFDTSAMDGYAIRVADLEAGRPLTVSARAAAGDAPGVPLPPGEAIRVMTGAPLPDGADTIVPVEVADAQSEPGRVSFRETPSRGDHVRRMGESIAAGTELLPAGRRLDPAGVALAALAGAEPVFVHRRPRVTVAVTGNELVSAGRQPGAGQLRDSNGPMLLALCRGRGVSAAAKLPVSDDEEAVRLLFAKAGDDEDVLITSGGVSAGDFDLLPAAAERAGFEMLFHGVAMRPGKPVAFARRGATLWLGLPGNPVSSAVCFRLFGRRALDALEGDDAPGPRFLRARVARSLSVRGRRETYRDARLDRSGSRIRIDALEGRGSHDLAAHAAADALLRIPAGAESLAEGDEVDYLPFEG